MKSCSPAPARASFAFQALADIVMLVSKVASRRLWQHISAVLRHGLQLQSISDVKPFLHLTHAIKCRSVSLGVRRVMRAVGRLASVSRVSYVASSLKALWRLIGIARA